MAFRRTSRRFARAPRKRAIWVNIPFGGVTFTETTTNQLLLTAEDWEAQFDGNANETAVLRAIRGDIVWSQTVAGTAGGTGFWGLYVADKAATVVPTFTTAGMGDVDWLRVGAFGVSTSVTTSLTSALQARLPIEVAAKRRLKSRDAVYLVGGFATDAASPAGVLSGLLRFLVARD
ncbi:hypothetical protein [Campylobacter coli]|uniref:hypothetical protein n=1 Tax=Campylobacter coli TaxID=195 RepID=UPI003F7BAC5B